MPRPRKQRLRREDLTDLYNQLQAVMPAIEELVHPREAREATQPYTSSHGPTDDTGSRYRFEKRGKEAWAVLDRYDGDALLAITRYKKGAEALIERLESYEQRIAELSPPSSDHLRTAIPLPHPRAFNISPPSAFPSAPLFCVRLPVLHRYRRAARSIGKIGGQFPILIAPMTSNPCRSYKGMFLGLVDSR